MFGLSSYKMARASGRNVIEAVNIAQALSIGPHCKAFYPLKEGSGNACANADLYAKGTVTAVAQTWETTPVQGVNNQAGLPAVGTPPVLDIGTIGGSSGRTMLMMAAGAIGATHAQTVHGLVVSLVGVNSVVSQGFRTGTREHTFTSPEPDTRGACFYDGDPVVKLRESIGTFNYSGSNPAWVDAGAFEGSTDYADITHSVPVTKAAGPVAVIMLVEGRLEDGVIPVTAVTYAPNSPRPGGGEWWNERSIANGRLIYQNGGIPSTGVVYPDGDTDVRLKIQCGLTGLPVCCGVACWVFPDGYDYSDWPQAVRWMTQEWYAGRRRHWPGWLA